MTHDTDDGFLHALSYEEMLPLEWRGADAGAVPAHLNDANEDMLRMLAILEERAIEKPEEGAAAAADIARLEAKVNLLLDMVGQVLANHAMLPGSVPVRLGAEGVEFAHTKPPQSGEHIVVDLYLHPRYPRPLSVLGEVDSVDDTGRGVSWVRVRFTQISPSVQDWLERFIFRRHRRMVAQARTAPHQ